MLVKTHVLMIISSIVYSWKVLHLHFGIFWQEIWSVSFWESIKLNLYRHYFQPRSVRRVRIPGEFGDMAVGAIFSQYYFLSFIVRGYVYFFFTRPESLGRDRLWRPRRTASPPAKESDNESNASFGLVLDRERLKELYDGETKEPESSSDDEPIVLTRKKPKVVPPEEYGSDKEEKIGRWTSEDKSYLK